ncbi:GDP-mannose 6-dehydrogenase [Trichodesmium erythraeum IMS101]|uniref:UDP-glucose 6-dehydrogenase n=1 Tax=Trichodesmium erythraeum (strain IMS101) TaxID=203124 RepID=Q112T3_TRIEI|nr:UDP-glucose/GDP-mannose dehydrogenase family protein [Trichodesmium erythraeum GBRTRLIN201]
MKVSMIGTGYVGLVSGVCFAEKGHSVICVDIDQDKVDSINQGIPPIYEKGLQELLQKNIGDGLQAVTDLGQAVQETEISMIAVGTPFDGKEIDLGYIKQVSQQIGEALRNKNSYHLVVIKSTVVPGTTENVVLPILEETSGKKAGVDFGLGMNPEFLREGEAIEDFMFLDRIILGGIDAKSISLLELLYQVFEGIEKLTTNCTTAEMIKYTANSLLATMISFSNEIGNLCSAVGGVDVVEVMQGVHLDKRFSPITASGDRITPAFLSYLQAGCGFGGSCFPKDIKALTAYGSKLGNQMEILEAAIRVNVAQPQKVLDLLKKHFPSTEGVKVSVLGLAFKPGTDDIRESPAIPIIESLLSQGAIVKTYDPFAQKEAQKYFCENELLFCDDLTDALDAVEAVIIVTCWSEFEALPRLLAGKDNPPVVVDGRRMLGKQSVSIYEGIGWSSKSKY